MNLFKENPLLIEAKESTSPVIELELNQPSITTSCGCTNVEVMSSPQKFKLSIDNLTPVKYMVNDIATKNYYIKTVRVNIYGEQLTINIKVTT